MTGVGEPPKRFLTIEQAAQELNVSEHQIRALLKAGEMRGIQIGGRGLWRIGVPDIERYIEEAYLRTASHVASGEIEVTDTDQEGTGTDGGH